jgi:dihydrofolate synthase/folylpolyglutamate synthase
VAMAFNYFAYQEVDVAVIETGLGGRLDSTNVISPMLSVITNISYDHTNLLGNTLPAIAFEKSGIVKSKIPVVIGKHNKETDPVFQDKAEEKESALYFAEDEFLTDTVLYKDGALNILYAQISTGKKIRVNSPLGGYYQVENIKTVLTAVEKLKNNFSIKDEDILNGIKNVISSTGLRGRWEILSESPLTIADVAHNEAGLSGAIQQISSFHKKQLHIVFGMVSDKDAGKALAILPKHAIYYFCCPPIPRGLPADELKNKALEFGLKGNSFPTVKEAFNEAKKKSDPFLDLIFITGSFFIVADVLEN